MCDGLQDGLRCQTDLPYHCLLTALAIAALFMVVMHVPVTGGAVTLQAGQASCESSRRTSSPAAVRQCIGTTRMHSEPCLRTGSAAAGSAVCRAVDQVLHSFQAAHTEPNKTPGTNCHTPHLRQVFICHRIYKLRVPRRLPPRLYPCILGNLFQVLLAAGLSLQYLQHVRGSTQQWSGCSSTRCRGTDWCLSAGCLNRC